MIVTVYTFSNKNGVIQSIASITGVESAVNLAHSKGFEIQKLMCTTTVDCRQKIYTNKGFRFSRRIPIGPQRSARNRCRR